jgi:PE family
MSLVTKRPEAWATAAGTQHDVGSKFSKQKAAAAAPPTGLKPAAADEASNLTAAQFAARAHMYQAACRRPRFTRCSSTTLSMSSRSYAAIKAVNTAADS